jgi:hypothetical protein
MLCVGSSYLESVLEPLDGLVTLDLVSGTNGGLASATLGNTLTRSGPINHQHPFIALFPSLLYSHAGVEVHSVNTNRWVVLDTEIDVFADTETEVASLREVALAELVFLDLQSTLQDFLGLWATDGDVHRDLLVTTDTEGTDGVSGLAYGNAVRGLPG